MSVHEDFTLTVADYLGITDQDDIQAIDEWLYNLPYRGQSVEWVAMMLEQVGIVPSH